MLALNYLIAIINLPVKVNLMVLAIFLLREGELLDPPVGASLGPKQEEIESDVEKDKREQRCC